jgi:uncharacterized protein YecE (DUF72 family)
LETPDVQTADFAYLRLRKENYSSTERKAIASKATNLAAQGDAYIYFKHEETPEGALNAEWLLQATAGNR